MSAQCVKWWVEWGWEERSVRENIPVACRKEHSGSSRERERGLNKEDVQPFPFEKVDSEVAQDILVERFHR